MPLYDFHCPPCRQTTELLMRTGAVAVCPRCGSAELIRLVSAPAAPGTSAERVRAARAAARREGHFSHYGATVSA